MLQFQTVSNVLLASATSSSGVSASTSAACLVPVEQCLQSSPWDSAGILCDTHLFVLAGFSPFIWGCSFSRISVGFPSVHFYIIKIYCSFLLSTMMSMTIHSSTAASSIPLLLLLARLVLDITYMNKISSASIHISNVHQRQNSR
jgi:hypothetical protein